MRANRTDYVTPVKIGKRVLVVGGGNVAMDAARTAKRLGADTKIVYRRGEKGITGKIGRNSTCKGKRGIEFIFLSSPIEILGDENAWVEEPMYPYAVGRGG